MMGLVRIAVLAGVLATTTASAEVRTWKNRFNSRTVEAELVGVEGDDVTLKRKRDGKHFKVSKRGLSDVDQQFIRHFLNPEVEPRPKDPEPHVPEPNDPDPEPKDPEPKPKDPEPKPKDPEPKDPDPEPSDPEPKDPGPSDPGPGDTQPADPPASDSTAAKSMPATTVPAAIRDSGVIGGLIVFLAIVIVSTLAVYGTAAAGRVTVKPVAEGKPHFYHDSGKYSNSLLGIPAACIALSVPLAFAYAHFANIVTAAVIGAAVGGVASFMAKKGTARRVPLCAVIGVQGGVSAAAIASLFLAYTILTHAGADVSLLQVVGSPVAAIGVINETRGIVMWALEVLIIVGLPSGICLKTARGGVFNERAGTWNIAEENIIRVLELDEEAISRLKIKDFTVLASASLALPDAKSYYRVDASFNPTDPTFNTVSVVFNQETTDEQGNCTVSSETIFSHLMLTAPQYESLREAARMTARGMN
jgi:hypothetical protein